MDGFGTILTVVLIIALIGLIWLVVELAVTVRKTRATVEEVHKQVEPTLASAQRIAA